MSTKYSDSQIYFIVSEKIKGKNYLDISREFNKKYKILKSPNAIKKIFNRNKDKYDITKIKKVAEKKLNSESECIVNTFIEFCIKHGEIPNYSDLYKEGIPKSLVNSHFKSINDLFLYAKKVKKDLEKSFFNETDLTLERGEYQRRKINNAIKKGKDIIITTVVSNSKVNIGIYKSLKLMEEKDKCLVIYMITHDPATSKEKVFDINIDPILKDEIIITTDTYLNSNVFLSGVQVSAKQINPFSGLKRLSRKVGCYIVASSKQEIEPLTSQHTDKAKYMVAPGAITLPSYLTTDEFKSKRSAYIANEDHIYGGIRFSILDNDKFNFRSLEFTKDGQICDLNKKFYDNKVVNSEVEVLAAGDLHIGDIDEVAFKTTEKISKLVKPKYLTLEDVFTGISVNHHNKGKYLQILKLAREDKLILRNELKENKEVLEYIEKNWNVKKEIIIKDSNHHKFLDRWVNEGRFREDNVNMWVGRLIEDAMLSGKEAVEFGIRDIAGLKSKKIRFLKKFDTFIVNGINNGVHSHLGKNGTRSISLQTLAEAYGPSTVGHSHYCRKKGVVIQNGTLEDLNPDYCGSNPNTRGQSCSLQFSNGTRQLIIYYKGEHKFKKG